MICTWVPLGKWKPLNSMSSVSKCDSVRAMCGLCRIISCTKEKHTNIIFLEGKFQKLLGYLNGSFDIWSIRSVWELWRPVSSDHPVNLFTTFLLLSTTVFKPVFRKNIKFAHLHIRVADHIMNGPLQEGWHCISASSEDIKDGPNHVKFSILAMEGRAGGSGGDSVLESLHVVSLIVCITKKCEAPFREKIKLLPGSDSLHSCWIILIVGLQMSTMFSKPISWEILQKHDKAKKFS